VTRALEGTREAITSGPLEPAILASAAIPGMFPPVSMGNGSYVDGGLVANCDLEAVVEAGIEQAVVVDVMGGGFDKPAPDVMSSVTRAVTFMIARQTEMQVRIWGQRLRLAMVRARLTIPPRVDSFVHTEALVDLGRHAGERVLAQHLDASWQVRPGTLEFTLPETVAEPPLATPPAAAETTIEQTDLDANPTRSAPR
jgi:predicted acylesterase/phospholipase RssA